MAWIEKLYATYESCKGNEPPGSKPLRPVSHTTQQARVEIVIDDEGRFRRACVVSREDATTLVPCTEKSASRSGKQPVNHPLCDKLQYVAGDFVSWGGEVTSGFAKAPRKPHEDYLVSLTAWAESEFGHPKVHAVLRYVKKGTVVADLVSAGILPVADGKLLKKWAGAKADRPAIFSVLTNDQTPDDAFVRWRIEDGETLASGTWEDTSLIESWDAHYRRQQSLHGTCMVTGEETILAEQHPAKLRNDADKAKLISANDKSGYTFRGRFTDDDGIQACTVGYLVSQKAHNALCWLIARQGYRSGDKQVFVAWAVSGKPVPQPWADSLAVIMGGDESSAKDETKPAAVGDAGQAFALKLNRAIAGYRAKLDPDEDVVVMGLDAATTGRSAITLYREFKDPDDFLARIQAWHEQYAWPQDYGADSRFVGAPAPKDIAAAAFGRQLEGKSGEKLRAATVERILPCIVDGLPLPLDLVRTATRRACNRIGMEKIKRGKQHFEDEWEKILGIACALFRGWSKSQGKEYAMALEEDRTTRDYLYGRLLAVADSIESYALGMVEKPRDTAAAQLMQRFADRPYSTWRTIELRLQPYISRLRSSEKKKVRAFLASRGKAMDEIHCRFASADVFTDDRPLNGEFLLGFHCQRADLFGKRQETEESSDE